MNRVRIAALAAVTLALLVSPVRASVSPVRIDHAKAPVPAWYTPELHQRVLKAGPRGVPLPKDAKVATSSLAFLGIRPGQLIIVNGGVLCSSNFVFTGGGRYYIGTAGHCGGVGDQVSMLYAPKGLVDIGTIVRSTGNPGARRAPDFALVQIHSSLTADISPSMAYWGGPTGVFTGTGIQPVLHAGWGLVVGTGGTPRAGLAYQWGDEYRFEGAIVFGDSGSGAVVAGGLAAGNITHIAVNTGDNVPVWNGGTRMTKILSYLGTGYSLATCSLAVPWPLPGCPPV